MVVEEVVAVANNAAVLSRAAQLGAEVIKYVVGGSVADTINNSPMSKAGIEALIVARIRANIEAAK